MARKTNERFPRIMPMRAFELLRELDQKAHQQATQTTGVDVRTREALAAHVRNALVRAGSR